MDLNRQHCDELVFAIHEQTSIPFPTACSTIRHYGNEASQIYYSIARISVVNAALASLSSVLFNADETVPWRYGDVHPRTAELIPGASLSVNGGWLHGM